MFKDDFEKLVDTDQAAARLKMAQAIDALQNYERQTELSFTQAFTMANTFIPQYADTALDAFGKILKNTQWSYYCASVVTQEATKTYRALLNTGDMETGRDALSYFLSYSRHRFLERGSVLGAAIDSLPLFGAMTTRHNANALVGIVTKLIDNAALADKPIFEKAIKANWQAVTRLDADLTTEAHSIIYRTYGTAQRNSALPEFIKTGREVLPEILAKNPESVITAATAIELASNVLLTGQMMPSPTKSAFITPSFARTGDLGKGIEQRWFFPSVNGRGRPAITTMTGCAFFSAAQELNTPESVPQEDRARIAWIRNVFSQAVDGIVPVSRAAERTQSPSSHLTLDAWQ